jgi:hypothetical protein
LANFIPEVSAFTLSCKGVLLQDTFTLLGLPSGSVVFVIPAITTTSPPQSTTTRRQTAPVQEKVV